MLLPKKKSPLEMSGLLSANNSIRDGIQVKLSKSVPVPHLRKIDDVSTKTEIRKIYLWKN